MIKRNPQPQELSFLSAFHPRIRVISALPLLVVLGVRKVRRHPPASVGRKSHRISVEMPKEKRLGINSKFRFVVILGLDPRIQNKKIFFPWIPGQAGDDRKKDSSTGSE